jgi:hypothetical protein
VTIIKLGSPDVYRQSGAPVLPKQSLFMMEAAQDDPELCPEPHTIVEDMEAAEVGAAHR